jgi:hypothetical protein
MYTYTSRTTTVGEFVTGRLPAISFTCDARRKPFDGFGKLTAGRLRAFDSGLAADGLP